MLWRYNPEWYHLIGSVCKKCGKKHYPRKRVCMYPCNSTDLEDVQLAHTGTIEHVGILTAYPSAGYFDVQPQVFASVRLDDNGPHVEAELVNAPIGPMKEHMLSGGKLEFKWFDSLVGRKVRMVVRRFRRHDNGDITYGHKFELIAE
jgi:hypothetical protein